MADWWQQSRVCRDSCVSTPPPIPTHMLNHHYSRPVPPVEVAICVYFIFGYYRSESGLSMRSLPLLPNVSLNSGPPSRQQSYPEGEPIQIVIHDVDSEKQQRKLK